MRLFDFVQSTAFYYAAEFSEGIRDQVSFSVVAVYSLDLRELRPLRYPSAALQSPFQMGSLAHIMM
jgi:hypothetical protein